MQDSGLFLQYALPHRKTFRFRFQLLWLASFLFVAAFLATAVVVTADRFAFTWNCDPTLVVVDRMDGPCILQPR